MPVLANILTMYYQIVSMCSLPVVILLWYFPLNYLLEAYIERIYVMSISLELPIISKNNAISHILKTSNVIRRAINHNSKASNVIQLKANRSSIDNKAYESKWGRNEE